MKIPLLMLLLMTLPVSAEQVIPLRQDDIKYIYDADTLFVHCSACPRNRRGVRVMGVDSPEIRGKCQAEKRLARQAKQFAVEKIRAAQVIELIPNPSAVMIVTTVY